MKSLKDLWSNIKWTDICTTEVQKGEETEKGAKNFWKKMAKNLPDLGKGNRVPDTRRPESSKREVLK